MAPDFKPGDRIAYRAAFLRSIGDYSHHRASRRGTVLDTRPAPLLTVQWDGAEERPAMVNAANVLHADRLHLEPA